MARMSRGIVASCGQPWREAGPVHAPYMRMSRRIAPPERGKFPQSENTESQVKSEGEHEKTKRS